MDISVYNQKAEEVGKMTLSNSVFAVPMNRDLLFQVATSQRANQRQVIAHAKGRGEVRGGGKKPWKQKGTGRARHGSSRSPIWIGGGVTHGPSKERDFKKKINTKMARKAVCIALSAKTKDDFLRVIDTFTLEAPKTKEMAKIMTNVTSLFKDAKKNNSMLIILPTLSESIKRTTRNLPNVDVVEARNLNTLSLLSYKYVVLMKDAAEVIEKTFKL